MNISVCITVLNEEKSVSRLLDSLISQSKKPDEIIIVDGGSTDKTIGIISHYQKRFNFIKLLKTSFSRSKGRNYAIELSRNEIIAITDAGCIADRYWLERISNPLRIESVDISAGFYKMIGETTLQKAMAAFLGVLPSKFDITFLPSARSMAFKKSAWEKVGGFPEKLGNTAEDTYFNYKATKMGLKYSRVKNAIVEWGMPKTLMDFFHKTYNYAKGDAESKIFIFPGKKGMSHNIIALFIIFRYLFALTLLILSFTHSSALALLVALLFLYLINAFKKARFWGIVLQLYSDCAVIIGFTHGILSKNN